MPLGVSEQASGSSWIGYPLRLLGEHPKPNPANAGLDLLSRCHPERSEGSGSRAAEMLRCAQHDSGHGVRLISKYRYILPGRRAKQHEEVEDKIKDGDDHMR
jgi:hypothetical protein